MTGHIIAIAIVVVVGGAFLGVLRIRQISRQMGDGRWRDWTVAPNGDGGVDEGQ